MSLDISGLPKLILLKRLILYSPPNLFIFDEDNAKAALERGYIDYLGGRAIKCDLTKDKIDPYLYNRDAGKGAFEKIVQEMRDEQF